MSPRPIHTCQQSKDLDRLVIEEFGIPGFELMTRAGCGAFDILRRHWPKCRKIAVICGRGNNGGDGYILAAAAVQSGMQTLVYQTGQPNSTDANRARDSYIQLGGSERELGNDLDLSDCDLVVDALFGSGLTRDIEGSLRQIMERIRSSGKPVLALDIPSGLDGDTGAVRGIALKADVTTTFISTKLGLVSGEGKDYRGILELDTLNIPRAAYRKVPEAAAMIDFDSLAAHKLKRKADAHKGSAGRVLVIGGNETMEGAALMAGRAAYRAGAGLVSIASVAGCAELICASVPEIRGFPVENVEAIEPMLQECDVAGVGPGLGQDDWAVAMWNAARQSSVRLVVDADALNLLAGQPHRRSDWILTPHPGEAGRLLGISAREVQSDRIGAAHRIVDQYGGICVLKGAGTIIAGGERTWLCDQGNPGMATGGMGDVLTGVICAIWAQGLSAEEAASLGVWLHASAGDDSAAESGAIGMMATDLLPGIRTNLSRAMDGAPGTN